MLHVNFGCNRNILDNSHHRFTVLNFIWIPHWNANFFTTANSQWNVLRMKRKYLEFCNFETSKAHKKNTMCVSHRRRRRRRELRIVEYSYRPMSIIIHNEYKWRHQNRAGDFYWSTFLGENVMKISFPISLSLPSAVSSSTNRTRICVLKMPGAKRRKIGILISTMHKNVSNSDRYRERVSFYCITIFLCYARCDERERERATHSVSTSQ